MSPYREIVMTETNGPARTSVDYRGSQPDHLSRYVRRTFRHALRGYNAADVDGQLQQVRGWFTLAGFDQLLADRRDEILGSALREAEATIAQARLEAEATIEQARREAEAILDEATRPRAGRHGGGGAAPCIAQGARLGHPRGDRRAVLTPSRAPCPPGAWTRRARG